ncbi:hypothetical protein [Pedobacter sp. UC225_65]|uniref:hypothetical protein n=1 Tax=Pedobacter sp. UC225_65 TaxID=3350173 RepID=UPI00366AD0A1
MEKNNDQGALQQPIGSGFNATSTASEVIKGIDLSGKTAIVTGGNAGIGLETTKVLAAAGATVDRASQRYRKGKEKPARHCKRRDSSDGPEPSRHY